MIEAPWTKQGDEPAFPDVLWSLPQTKKSRGSLLIAGGSNLNLNAVNVARETSLTAGIGEVHLALPDNLSAIVPHDHTISFLTSKGSNSFNRESIKQLLELSASSDATLLCGDVGRSSQTAHTLSALLIGSSSKMIVSGDAIDLFNSEPHVILDRKNTVVVAKFGQLQRLLNGKGSLEHAITSTMGAMLLSNTMRMLNFNASIITFYEGQVYVFCGTDASATKYSKENKTWSTVTASHAAVLTVQHPASAFEALTTAVFQAKSPSPK